MAIVVQDTKLKHGYKQTEAGVIPEDWGVSTVGAEFEIQLGKMLDSEKNRGILKPYLGNKAIQWNHIDISDLQMMAMSRSDLERFCLRYGDLLVCEGGEVGRAAMWEAPLEECYYQKALHRLRPLRGFNPRLMLAFLRYWTDYGKLANYISQTSIAHLTREKLIEVPIPVSPPEEQQAIVTVLSDLDTLITSLDQLISKKRDIKQAMMQLLLSGKMRLPDFSGEWEVKKMSEVAEVIMGQSPLGTSYNRDGNGYPLINGPTEFTNKYPIKIQWTTQPTKICKKDDILLCVRGSSTGRINISNDNYCIGRGIAAIRAKSGTDVRYLTMQVHFAVINILALTTGSTFPNIDGKSIRSIEFPVPPFLEQQAIATILSDIDAEISALEQRREKTRALKQAMMQELLTGKTRLLHEYDRAEGTSHTESGDPTLQETGVQVSGELGRTPEQSQYRAESAVDPLSQAAGI